MSDVSPRFRAPRRATVVVALLTALGVLLQPLLATTAQAASKPPVPTAKTLPSAIEPLPSYQAPVACDPVAKAGPKKLVALLKKTYGSTAFGLTRPCDGAVPSSEHMEGRAVDWMLGSGTTKADENAFVAWLLKTDAQGNAVAMARRMGIMYIVWQNQIFRVYNPGLGWQPYEDCKSAARKSAVNDTYCHRNHMHFSFTWDGATAKTSYWSGKAITVPDCDKPWNDPGKASPSAKGLQYVALPETPVLDTNTGLGTTSGQPCRLAQNGYSGEGRRLDVQVAGAAGVPANARAVVLQVRDGSPNATGALRVQPAGASTWAADAVSTTVGVSDGNLVTVPVGGGGAVTFTLTTGQTYLAVDVLGYFIAPGDPAGTELHAVRPKVAFTSTTPLVSASTTGLTRAQLGVPASATAVSLAVTISGGSVGGGVRVYGADAPAPPVRAAAPTAGSGRVAAAATVVRLGAGTASTPVVSIRNGTGTRNVQVVVTGWYAPASVAGGALFQTVRPATMLDTAKKQGLASALAPGVSRTVKLTGHGVPSKALVVVGQARLSATAQTRALVWAGGAEPTARAFADEAGRIVTTQLLTQLGSGGKAAVASDAGSTNLRIVAVGAWVA